LAAGVLLGAAMAWAQPDYAPAHWSPPSCTKWYTSGYTRQFCVIHDMEGYYLGSISYLNSCATDTSGNYTVDASVYYLVNGVQNGPGENSPSDPVAGDITQSVRESNYAWHVSCWNKYMFGTEHEGFVSNPAWFTEAMYQASAGLQRHLCDTYNIPKDRNHIIGHGEWQNAAWKTWMAANWPQIDTTCNTHTDPGIFWDWSHFMALLTGINTNIGVYWDRNGATAGAGSSPSGTWDQSSSNWSSDPNGAATPGLWGTQTAIFSAGSDATNAYTVTVGGTVAVNNLVVRQGTVTFSGGQLNFIGFGSYYSNYVAAGCTAIFNTPFGGTGSPDKWGPGTAVYNGASTSSGYYTLNEGTLAFGNNSALGTIRLVVGELAGVQRAQLQHWRRRQSNLLRPREPRRQLRGCNRPRYQQQHYHLLGRPDQQRRPGQDGVGNTGVERSQREHLREHERQWLYDRERRHAAIEQDGWGGRSGQWQPDCEHGRHVAAGRGQPDRRRRPHDPGRRHVQDRRLQ
jgi:hypothetical protein